MSNPPPPPFSPPPGPEGFPPSPGPGGFSPPPGYQQFPGQPAPSSGNSGLAIASLVLSLVGLVPCFWVLQLPGLLGVIFGFVGLSQTKNNARGGRGMAVAGLVIGVILLLICVGLWIYFISSGNCVRDGSTWRCTTD